MNLNENKNSPSWVEVKKQELGLPSNVEVQIVIGDNEETLYRFYIWGEREVLDSSGNPGVEKYPVVLKTLKASEL